MPHGKSMDNREKILQLVRKSRNGISVKKIARALKIDDGTVYKHLANMQNQIRLDRGIVFSIDRDDFKVSRSHPLFMFVLLIGLASFLGVILGAAYVDPSLRLLNATVINPARAIVFPVAWLMFPFVVVGIIYLVFSRIGVSRARASLGKRFVPKPKRSLTHKQSIN